MIKSELVQRISMANPHLYQRDVENIVNAILNEITGALAEQRELSLDRLKVAGFRRDLLAQGLAFRHKFDRIFGTLRTEFLLKSNLLVARRKFFANAL